MKQKRIWTTAALIVFCCAALVAARGDEIKIKGVIIGRTDETITVRTTESEDRVFALDDFTKVQLPRGLGLRKKQVSRTSLVPGLRVTVKSNRTDERGILVAKEINFNKSDLETAKVIQGALVPVEEKVEANREAIAANTEHIEANEEAVDRRFSDLAQYGVQHQLVVYFPSGSSDLSRNHRVALAQLATAANELQGYLVQVTGFADTTGDAARNQALSRERAEAVITYLVQACGVPPHRIVPAAAMGVSNPAASNETAEGRAHNRRAEISVLVNKGIRSGR